MKIKAAEFITREVLLEPSYLCGEIMKNLKPPTNHSLTPPKRTRTQKALELSRARHHKAVQALQIAEEAAAIEDADRVEAIGAADFLACIRAISPEILDTITIHIIAAAKDTRQQESVQNWVDNLVSAPRSPASSQIAIEDSTTPAGASANGEVNPTTNHQPAGNQSNQVDANEITSDGSSLTSPSENGGSATQDDPVSTESAAPAEEQRGGPERTD